MFERKLKASIWWYGLFASPKDKVIRRVVCWQPSSGKTREYLDGKEWTDTKQGLAEAANNVYLLNCGLNYGGPGNV